jgi:hypothetical protein
VCKHGHGEQIDLPGDTQHQDRASPAFRYPTQYRETTPIDETTGSSRHVHAERAGRVPLRSVRQLREAATSQVSPGNTARAVGEGYEQTRGWKRGDH